MTNQDTTPQPTAQQKYLDPYTLEVGADELTRPSAIISYQGKCQAYNSYGDQLTISQKQCKKLLANPGLIPKKRTNYTQDTQQQPIQTQQPTPTPAGITVQLPNTPPTNQIGNLAQNNLNPLPNTLPAIGTTP